MKTDYAKLNIWAFGVAGGIVGFLSGIWMFIGYAGTPFGNYMMMPVGSIVPHNWLSLWMAVCFGIVGLVLAGLYNWLSERMG